VPVLVHGAFRLYETQAILRYLDRVVPTPPLTPTEAEAAARMDQLMNINDWYLFQGVANVIVFERKLAPWLLGRAADEGAIAAAMPKAHTVFDELARQLGGKPYFVDEALTLADVLLAPQLDLFSETPEWEPLTARHANLRAWVERLRARPSLLATTREAVTARAQAAA
jgi:glutathione S-transferase